MIYATDNDNIINEDDRPKNQDAFDRILQEINDIQEEDESNNE